MSVSYLHLPVGGKPPPIEAPTPYKAVVILDQATPDDWQNEISDWLVATGCLYMMAWGPKCSSWDDSVDWANLAKFNHSDIPDDQSVMTTWHDAEPLSETFWFAANCAIHPTVELARLLIVDVTHTSRRWRY